MKTKTSFKTKLLIALLSIAMWPVAALAQTTIDKIEEFRGQGYSVTSITPVFSQLVAFSLPASFITVSENAQDGIYMREAIPKGETVNNWTQMLTLSGFKGLAKNPKLDLVTFSNLYMEQMVKKCSPNASGGKVTNLKVGEHDALIYFVSCANVNYLGAAHSEQTLFLSIKGESDYYMILLAERGAPQESIPVFERDKWANRFNQIKPIRLCPRALGESPPYPSCAKG